ASPVPVKPDNRGVGVATGDQGPRDAVGLRAGELWADPLRDVRVTKHFSESVEGLLENAAFVASGANHANERRGHREAAFPRVDLCSPRCTCAFLAPDSSRRGAVANWRLNWRRPDFATYPRLTQIGEENHMPDCGCIHRPQIRARHTIGRKFVTA